MIQFKQFLKHVIYIRKYKKNIPNEFPLKLILPIRIYRHVYQRHQQQQKQQSVPPPIQVPTLILPPSFNHRHHQPHSLYLPNDYHSLQERHRPGKCVRCCPLPLNKRQVFREINVPYLTHVKDVQYCTVNSATTKILNVKLRRINETLRKACQPNGADTKKCLFKPLLCNLVIKPEL